MRLSRRIIFPSLLGAGLAVRGDVILAGDAQLPAITVGALRFTESSILAEMLAHLLHAAGYTVQVAHGMGTSAETHEALLGGEIDMYVEYTGGGLVAILGLPVPTAAEAGLATPPASIADVVYDTVSTAYREEFGLVWLDELGFNNAYALAVTPETAATHDLVTVSDLAAHAGELVLGTDLEFPDRQDGLPGLEETYGITFGEVVPGEPALMYAAIASGDVDVITAYTTDAHLRDLDLVFLDDDMGFFPPYHAAPVVRQALLADNPDIATAINQLAGQIDEAEMIDMNSQVDLDGLSPADVARAFLATNGLLEVAG